MEKTLILLRHAKAEAGQDDHARPLAARGVEEAKRMGAYMQAQGILPQKILCSTARRTRQTLENILHAAPSLTLPLEGEGSAHKRAGGGDRKIEYSDATYNASEAQHLKNIAAQSDEIESLMIIAHNPGLHQLALKLSREGDHAQLRQMAQEFPPASLVVIDLGDIGWSDIFTARGVLRTFITPKTL